MNRKSEAHPAERIPDTGLDGASAVLELPSRGEGFDQLFFVRMDEHNGFAVVEWKDEA